MKRSSHQLSAFVRPSSTQFFLDYLFQRSRGPLPWHLRKISFFRLRASPSYKPTTRQENKHIGPAKTVCLRPNQPFIRKPISAVRRKRQGLQLMWNSLAFAAFSAFIAWDIRHLSHDERDEGEIQSTVREDPAAALSYARHELATMVKDKRSRC